MSKKKLIKGKDYDGWVWKWDTWTDGTPCSASDMAYTFKVKRADITSGVSKTSMRWAQRNGRRLVRVKLVEVKP